MSFVEMLVFVLLALIVIGVVAKVVVWRRRGR
jgi:hypothetical protein